MKRFLYALLISVIFFGAAAAMLCADAVSHSIGGERGRVIFSYDVKSENLARLELFGCTFDVDRAPLKVISALISSAGEFFSEALPNAVRIYGEALSRGISQLYSCVAENSSSSDETSADASYADDDAPENADGV